MTRPSRRQKRQRQSAPASETSAPPKPEPKPVAAAPKVPPKLAADPLPPPETPPPLTTAAAPFRSGRNPKSESLAQAEERLEQASGAAKSLIDYRTVTEKGLVLADRAIVEDNADLAKASLRKSLAAARKADNLGLAKAQRNSLSSCRTRYRTPLKTSQGRGSLSHNRIRLIEENKRLQQRVA